MVITLAPEIIVMGLFFTSRGCWYSMALVPGGLRGNLVQVLVQKFTLFHQLELEVFHGTDGLHRLFGATRHCNDNTLQYVPAMPLIECKNAAHYVPLRSTLITCTYHST